VAKALALHFNNGTPVVRRVTIGDALPKFYVAFAPAVGKEGTSDLYLYCILAVDILSSAAS
jgi:hypothetical protein